MTRVKKNSKNKPERKSTYIVFFPFRKLFEMDVIHAVAMYEKIPSYTSRLNFQASKLPLLKVPWKAIREYECRVTIFNDGMTNKNPGKS